MDKETEIHIHNNEIIRATLNLQRQPNPGIFNIFRLTEVILHKIKMKAKLSYSKPLIISSQRRSNCVKY